MPLARSRRGGGGHGRTWAEHESGADETAHSPAGQRLAGRRRPPYRAINREVGREWAAGEREVARAVGDGVVQGDVDHRVIDSTGLHGDNRPPGLREAGRARQKASFAPGPGATSAGRRRVTRALIIPRVCPSCLISLTNQERVCRSTGRCGPPAPGLEERNIQLSAMDSVPRRAVDERQASTFAGAAHVVEHLTAPRRPATKTSVAARPQIRRFERLLRVFFFSFGGPTGTAFGHCRDRDALDLRLAQVSASDFFQGLGAGPAPAPTSRHLLAAKFAPRVGVDQASARARPRGSSDPVVSALEKKPTSTGGALARSCLGSGHAPRRESLFRCSSGQPFTPLCFRFEKNFWVARSP